MSYQVNLDLRHLTPSELADLLDSMGTNMQGKPAFKNPPIPFNTLISTAKTGRTKIADQDNAQKASHAATADMHKWERDARDIVRQVASFVQIAAKGDESIIKSAGLDPKAHAVHHEDIPAPAGFAVTRGDREQSADWMCDPLPDAQVFIVEGTPDPTKADSWKTLGTFTESKGSLFGLPSGTLSLRVTAVGTRRRTSAPSTVVTLKIA